MKMDEVIARNISNALSHANKKQQELADAIGVTKQTVSKMLNGGRMISASELCGIAKFLNMSVDSLAEEKKDVVYSPITVFMGEVKTPEGREGIKTAERLMDMYSYHHKFKTEEFKDKCNQVWSDE